MTIDQLQPHPNKYIIVAMGFAGLTLPSLCIFVFLLNRYFCFKIYVGKEGFYYQTNPFNGNYYMYEQVKHANENLMVSHHRGHGRTYYHYFVFTLKNGEQKKVLFEKALYEKEINVLIERINTVA